jgi:peptide/nickel transport system permease protein
MSVSLATSVPDPTVWKRPPISRLARTPVAAVVLGALVLGVIVVPVLSGVDPQAVSLLETNAPPSSAHWWGTDSLGRDVLVRVASGGRLSLGVGIGAMAMATLLGTGLGGAAALGGAWPDRLISRSIDLLLALPSIPLLIVLQSVAPRGALTLVAVLGISRCGEIARLSRAQCQATLRDDFVLASAALGASRLHIFSRHLLPHLSSVLTVSASLAFAGAIIAESTLSFLGLGLPPEEPSWGTMLSSAQDNVLGGAWWAVVFPGLAIAIAVFCINAISDSLRDRFIHV